MKPRPLYWSIRRELWENRAIYVAPAVVATVVLFSFIVGSFRLPVKARDPQYSLHMPLSMCAAAILFTGFVVSFFYCLDALNSERRDRSILFWKSLPVSDFTTVLSKAAIPMAVQPLLSFTIALITQIVMFIIATGVLLIAGINPFAMWSRVPFIEMTCVMFYGLVVHALWFAPLYGYLLFMSAWARRAVFIWAFLPIFALFILQMAAYGIHPPIVDFFKYRLGGAMIEAFKVNAANHDVSHFSQLDPLRFLTSSGLWWGLLFAAGFIAIAVKLRRARGPI